VESLFWALGTRDPVALAWPVFLSLAFGFLLLQNDLVTLLGATLARVALLGRADPFARRGPGGRPSGLVIIPSLLRNRGDLEAIRTTVASSASNGYPGELVVVASVDGRTEQPSLYRELETWIAALRSPANVTILLGGTETRLGKMMAVEAAVVLVKDLVARGRLPAFPELYFSIDGDGTLSENALERLAARLVRPHPLTGNPRRVVSGKICIRPDLFWSGWRQAPASFFSVRGQIYLQVAREFLLSNIARFNWKPTPQIGIPGALYCTWSELLLAAPRYMGFMKTVRIRDMALWALGVPPPLFSRTRVEPCPEALTGASDDTCIAFLASIASWKDGRLSFDAPRTTVHALGRLLMGYFFERSHDYEPEARVYTYTPATIRGLWKQRVRWNSSRFECAGRFWRAFAFHWEIGFPTSSHLWLVLQHVFDLTVYYVLLPYAVFRSSNAVFVYVLGYGAQTVAYSIYTSLALLLERERRRFWPVLFALPLAAFYGVAINFFGCVVGVVRDVFLFGNPTDFAPEWTLRRGRTERIALLFRVRRFFALAARAVVCGDVPFGAFWLGWGETPWTPSGYDGWTTKRGRRRIVPPLSAWRLLRPSRRWFPSRSAAAPQTAERTPMPVAASAELGALDATTGG